MGLVMADTTVQETIMVSATTQSKKFVSALSMVMAEVKNFSSKMEEKFVYLKLLYVVLYACCIAVGMYI